LHFLQYRGRSKYCLISSTDGRDGDEEEEEGELKWRMFWLCWSSCCSINSASRFKKCCCCCRCRDPVSRSVDWSVLGSSKGVQSPGTRPGSDKNVAK
jgi:hypothetical protein